MRPVFPLFGSRRPWKFLQAQFICLHDSRSISARASQLYVTSSQTGPIPLLLPLALVVDVVEWHKNENPTLNPLLWAVSIGILLHTLVGDISDGDLRLQGSDMPASTRAVLTEKIRESRDVLRSRGPPIETELGPLLQICHKSFTACQFRFVRFFLVLLRVFKACFSD